MEDGECHIVQGAEVDEASLYYTVVVLSILNSAAAIPGIKAALPVVLVQGLKGPGGSMAAPDRGRVG